MFILKFIDKKIKFKVRFADKIIKNYTKVERWVDHGNDFVNLVDICLVLGANNEKGSCALTVSIVSCFEDNRDHDVLDLGRGKIECHQNKMDLLKILFVKIRTSINLLNHRSECTSFIMITSNNKK